MTKAKKTKPEVESVKSRYQPSPAELQEDLRVNATPEQAAKSVMQRVKKVKRVSRPKVQPD